MTGSAHHQRRRAALALAELAHDRGLAAVTTDAICGRARISRSTFYALFSSLANCRSFAFCEAYGQLFGNLGAADTKEPWPAGLRAALEHFSAAIAAEPALAELCLVHSFAAAKEAHGHDCEAAVLVLTETLRGARAAAASATGPAYLGPPSVTEELLARGIVSLAALRVGRGEPAALVEQQEEVVALATAAFPGSG